MMPKRGTSNKEQVTIQVVLKRDIYEMLQRAAGLDSRSLRSFAARAIQERCNRFLAEEDPDNPAWTPPGIRDQVYYR